MDFMTEFARYLVAAGFSTTRFAQLTRRAYFQAASLEARFRNERVNQSAVAAMTGLTRAQVRSLVKNRSPRNPAQDSRIQRLIGGWTTDATFITERQLPRRLPLRGKTGSFSDLCRKYGGDVPVRSLLREMSRHEIVSVDGDYVRLRPEFRRTNHAARLVQVSAALARAIKLPVALPTSSAPVKSVSLDVTYPSASAAGRILMQRRLSKSLKAFLADIHAAGVAVALESPPRMHSPRKRTSTRLLLLTQDEDV
jgi:hypothetical protein